MRSISLNDGYILKLKKKKINNKTYTNNTSVKSGGGEGNDSRLNSSAMEYEPKFASPSRRKTVELSYLIAKRIRTNIRTVDGIS